MSLGISGPAKPEGFRLPWGPKEASRPQTDIHVHANWLGAGFWLGIGFWAARVAITVATAPPGPLTTARRRAAVR